MLTLLTSTLCLFEPTVRLPNGHSVTLYGSGPPVVFSSGLFGTMPRRLYTKLFRKMTPNVTLAVLNDVAPVTVQTVEDIAESLSVDKVSFFSHSSFDASILNSPVLHSAVLCDPVVLPTWEKLPEMVSLLLPALPSFSPSSKGSSSETGRTGQTGTAQTGQTGQTGTAQTAQTPSRVLILKADLAYESAETAIPDFLGPEVWSSRCVVHTFPGVGHADLLDDPWAEMGKQIPWVSGASAPKVPFVDWKFPSSRSSVRQTRETYRTQLARVAVDHLLHPLGGALMKP